MILAYFVINILSNTKASELTLVLLVKSYKLSFY